MKKEGRKDITHKNGRKYKNQLGTVKNILFYLRNIEMIIKQLDLESKSRSQDQRQSYSLGISFVTEGKTVAIVTMR